jgi:CO dehydrogenase/acetyl-CoA synthase beta subunit
VHIEVKVTKAKTVLVVAVVAAVVEEAAEEEEEEEEEERMEEEPSSFTLRFFTLFADFLLMAAIAAKPSSCVMRPQS